MLLRVANAKNDKCRWDTCRFCFVIELNYLPSANTRSCSTAACPKIFK